MWILYGIIRIRLHRLVMKEFFLYIIMTRGISETPRYNISYRQVMEAQQVSQGWVATWGQLVTCS